MRSPSPPAAYPRLKVTPAVGYEPTGANPTVNAEPEPVPASASKQPAPPPPARAEQDGLKENPFAKWGVVMMNRRGLIGILRCNARLRGPVTRWMAVAALWVAVSCGGDAAPKKEGDSPGGATLVAKAGENGDAATGSWQNLTASALGTWHTLELDLDAPWTSNVGFERRGALRQVR